MSMTLEYVDTIEEQKELYKRQKDLDLHIPESATIIGCGGVGAWVGLNLALIGVSTLYLVDYDKIEKHNLNRTPFKQSHIGDFKVTALANLIGERRNAEVIPITKKIEDPEVNLLFMDEIKESVIIDCKDNVDPLPNDLESNIIGGYDGLDISLHINPKPESIWGDEPTRYEITPSYVVPPQFLASMITLYLTTNDLWRERQQIKNTNMIEVFNQIMRGNNE